MRILEGEVLVPWELTPIYVEYGYDPDSQVIVVGHTQRALNLRRQLYKATGAHLVSTVYRDINMYHDRDRSRDDQGVNIEKAKAKIDTERENRVNKRAQTLRQKEIV